MYNKPDNLKIIDLFSGIGGFRLASEKLNFQCQAYSEINKFALETYYRNFDNSSCVNLGDINKINIENLKQSYKNVDILTGGVPCQPWSVGGKNLGFNDYRGLVWFNTIRVIEAIQPTIFVLENVPGLTYKRHKESFKLILNLLKNAGYTINYSIFNSKNFNSCQDRPRLFIIGCSKESTLSPTEIIRRISNKSSTRVNSSYKPYTFCDLRGGEFTIHSWELYKTSKVEKEICNWLLTNRRKTKYSNKDGSPIRASEIRKQLNLNKNTFYKAIKNLLKLEIIIIISNTHIEFKNRKLFLGINGIHRVYYKNTDQYPTLVSLGNNDCIIDENIKSKQDLLKHIKNNNYRKLNVIDYKKIQGFPESFISCDNPKEAKKQYGNSITIPLVEEILTEIKFYLEQNYY